MMGAGEPLSKFDSFVGRERELAELVSACESGADADAHLFLIHGEPGIGKTRLADELASRAKVRGIQVLWGRCWEGDGAPAYWPWIQVIRGFLGALDSEQRRLALESEVATDTVYQVAQIVPDLRPVQPIRRAPASENIDSHQARFRLFDAVTGFFKMGARSQPMLIVLDDLHDADEASLGLLHFMARELRGASILLVATYRESEVRRSPALSKFIGELSREARSIPVGGLSQSEVKRLVEFRAGQTPDDALVAKLCAATNGNPLFVDGIVRNLIAEGAMESAGAAVRPFTVPSGVREAIRDRLDRVSPEANALLAVAAAIGNEFEFDLFQSVSEVSADQARRLVDEASSAGIVTAQGSGRLRFSHALIRSAVYDELDSSSRVAIHRKIGERMEEIYRADIDAHLAELAHHFREASDSSKAIEYSIRAGHAAWPVGANAEAVRHWEAALELMEKSGTEALPRAELQDWLGRVGFVIDQFKSVRYRESAITLYESLGYMKEAGLMRVSLGRTLATTGLPVTDLQRATEHLRRAEPVLTQGPETAELALLYEAFSACEQVRLDLAKCSAAARRGIEVSERIGAKLPWLQMTACEGWMLGLRGRLKDAFALFDQAFEVADQVNLPGSGLPVTAFASALCCFLGDPKKGRAWGDREISRARNVHYRWARDYLTDTLCTTHLLELQLEEGRNKVGLKHPFVQFWLTGEWESAAAFLESVIEASERVEDRNVSRLNVPPLLGVLYWNLGDLTRAASTYEFGLNNDDREPVVIQEMRVRPFLSCVYLSMGRADEAAEQVARCRKIMAEGEDWRSAAGFVARAEGLLEAARGNYEAANTLIDDAQKIFRLYNMRGDLAFAILCSAISLSAAGERAKAGEMFDRAIDMVRSAGVTSRFIESWTLKKELALASNPTWPDLGRNQRAASPAANAHDVFRREGEFWTIAFAGATFRLKTAKGLHYIAYLLAHPGQRFHVHDLIEAVEGSPANGPSTVHAESEDLEIVRDIGGAGPTIDGRARSEYRERLRDLQIDLDEAERMNDLGRRESLRREIEMLGQQLTGSSGLGGHGRNVPVSAERARGLVGKNIRAALDKIRDQHPALGRHFATAISTGYFCVYQPDPDRPISWQL